VQHSAPDRVAPRGTSTRRQTRSLVLASLGAVVAVGLLSSALTTQETAAANEGLITLYEHDDVASSFSFRTGEHGGRVIDGQIELGAAQLVYGSFATGLISFGFGADEAVNVVDLGTAKVDVLSAPSDAALKFPVGIFQTLGVSGRRLTFQQANGSQVRLGAGNAVFDVPRRGLQHVEAIVDHVYAIRFQRTRGDRRDMLAKFQVVEHRPGESVTLRWANIGSL
jgi:hypothetical protein